MRPAMTGEAHDDFPANAFALLPPSSAFGVANASNTKTPIVLHAGVCHALESAAEDELSSGKRVDWNERVQLYHTEQRATIQSLYDTIESLGQDNERLREQCARMNGSLERAKKEVEASSSRWKQQIREQDAQILQLQEKLKLGERTQQRLEQQVTDLNATVEEKEATISTLQSLIKELESKQEDAEVRGCQGELQKVADLWTVKEREVGENTHHVQQSVSAIQRLGEQLQLQLHQVEAELQAAERDHTMFREFMAEHQQQAGHDNVTSTPRNENNTQALEAQARSMRALEHKVITLESENKTLRVKCQEVETHVELLSSLQLQHREQSEKNAVLIAKYEASARDGTETIAELHESLVKLCEQLSEERKTSHEQQNQQIQAAVEKEGVLQAQIEDAEDRFAKARSKMEEAQADLAADRKICHKCKSGIRSVAIPAPSETGIYPPTCTKSEREQETLAAAQVPADKPDVVDASNAASLRVIPELPKATSKAKKTARVATGVCRTCNEKTFGFVVRCQKCTDPFHVGCVKIDGSGIRKQLGYIFMCSDCTPQRPTKVARSGGKKDAVSAASSALPLETVPSRTTGGSRKERS